MRGDFLPSRAVKVEFFYRTPFDHLMKTLLFGLFAFWHQLLAQDIQRFVAVDNVCAWPALTLLADGSINATLFAQPSHGRVAGTVEVWNSPDGQFWQKRGITAPNDPSTNRMNHAAGLAKNSDLIVLCSGWTDVKQPQRPKQSPFRDDILPLWVCRSSNGGATWTQIKDFPAPDLGWTHYIPFGDIKKGVDGSLYVSCYSGEFIDPTKSFETKSFRAWFFRSTDDGKTWQRVGLISPTGSETAILHLGEQRWLAASRESALDFFISKDDGATWSSSNRVTEKDEVNGHLLRLQDGRILLSYGNRIKGQTGVLAKITADEGKTWTQPTRLVTTLSADCGYPSTVQRADGKLVTAWYSKASEDHNRYHMGVAVWDVPSLLGRELSSR